MNHYTRLLETSFIFVLAASVRLSNLGQYLIVDEEDRWNWAVEFYNALLVGDLSGTLVGDGYPGIFPVWLETLWLFAASVYRSLGQGAWIGQGGVYSLTHEWGRLSHLALQRFPIVLTNTLLVLVIFLYLRRLFDRRVALLAAILISLDPFLLSDSRVNRAEALLTGLMAVSCLALLVSLRETNRRQLIISACFGGLAWLTKSQALVLLPIFASISLIWWWRTAENWRMAGRGWVMTMFSWSIVAGLVFCLLWPATWTVPDATFSRMANYATRKVGAEGVNLFFLGRTLVDEDPGPLFYPVILLLRITPLTLAGLGLGIWLLVQHRPNRLSDWRNRIDQAGVWMLVAYCLLYAGGMSLGSHKQDRFLMTIFPMLNILAALAYIRFIDQRRWLSQRAWAAGGLVLTLQLLTTLPFHPYYFSYFNPLLGGGPVASRLTRIGWGEGMDQVAAYLNTLESPEELTVAARFYKYLLGFEGQALNLEAGGEWTRADKIIFYIQQVQRMQDPSPGLIRYFQNHIPPETIITIDRIVYATIYPNPITVAANPQVSHLENELALFGYIWPDQGQTLRLVWFNHRPVTNRRMMVRLSGADSHTPWILCQLMPDFVLAGQTAQEVVESGCDLSQLPALPSSLYDLEVATSRPDSPIIPLSFPEGRRSISVSPNGELAQLSFGQALDALAAGGRPDDAIPVNITYGERLRLVGYRLDPPPIQAGQTITLTLYWQQIAPMKQDYTAFAHLFTIDEVRLGGADLLHPTSTWRLGEVRSQTYHIPIDSGSPAPLVARLDVGLYDRALKPLRPLNAQGDSLTWKLTHLKVIPQIWPALTQAKPVQATFSLENSDIDIHLAGYHWPTDAIKPGHDLPLTLFWRTTATPTQDYVIFVQLLDQANQVVAQHDGPPRDGHYPTSWWVADETIADLHLISLPADLPTGIYRLIAGLYRPDNGQRLPVAAGQAFGPDAVMLETLQLRMP